MHYPCPGGKNVPKTAYHSVGTGKSRAYTARLGAQLLTCMQAAAASALGNAVNATMALEHSPWAIRTAFLDNRLRSFLLPSATLFSSLPVVLLFPNNFEL